MDDDAEVLDPRECAVRVPNDEIKDLETNFFTVVKYESSLLFGGTLGTKSGGVTAFAISTNGRLICWAISNGAILVYDTKSFQLVRIFSSQSTTYSYLEFSRDNYS